MNPDRTTFVGFVGHTRVTEGHLADVALALKEYEGTDQRIAVFDERTGSPIDLDLRGSGAEIIARLADHPMVDTPDVASIADAARPEPTKPRGRGRPRLGVVSREVSLLPRHWDWLKHQRGGASATLRRLVDEARKANIETENRRAAINAAYSFMSDMAGDQPGYEEASRALFAGELTAFEVQIKAWPEGLRAQLARFIDRARGSTPSPS